jgi:hypothetical protein
MIYPRERRQQLEPVPLSPRRQSSPTKSVKVGLDSTSLLSSGSEENITIKPYQASAQQTKAITSSRSVWVTSLSTASSR